MLRPDGPQVFIDPSLRDGARLRERIQAAIVASRSDYTITVSRTQNPHLLYVTLARQSFFAFETLRVEVEDLAERVVEILRNWMERFDACLGHS